MSLALFIEFLRYIYSEMINFIELEDMSSPKAEEKLKKGIDNQLDDLLNAITDEIPITLYNEYIDSMLDTEKITLELKTTVSLNTYEQAKKVTKEDRHKTSINNIVSDTMTDLAAAIRTAKQYANKNIDKALNHVNYEIENGLLTGMDTRSISKRVAQKFADQNMTAFVTVDGKHLPLDFYAKTVVRTKIRTARNHAALNRYKDKGIKHVYVTGNIPTCGECARYRGIVFATERGDTFPYINLYTTFPLHPNCECNFRPWIMKFKSKQEIDQAKDKAKTFNPDVDPRTQKERDKYKDEQKRRQLARRKQMSYNKMKSKLGKEGPQSYAEYTNAFNNNKPLYHTWVAKMKDLSKGNKNVIMNTQDNLINELTDHTIEWASKLNEDQLQDIAKYGMHDYKIIHKYLDDNITGKNPRYSKKIETKISNIYQALSLYNFDKPLTLYRGINRSEYLELKSNNKLKMFKSFKSTSIAEDIAQEFQADHRYGCMVILHVPPYVNGGFIAPIVDLPDEKEFLLNLGTEYKVIKEYNKNGMKYLEIEVKSYDN